jgi:hypothetical protein
MRRLIVAASLLAVLLAAPSLQAQTRRRTVGTWLLGGGRLTLFAESSGRLYLGANNTVSLPVVLSVTPDSVDAWIDTVRKVLAMPAAAAKGEEVEWHSAVLSGVGGTRVLVVIKAAGTSVTYGLEMSDRTGLVTPGFLNRIGAEEFLIALRKGSAVTRLMSGLPSTPQDSVFATRVVDDCALSYDSPVVRLVGDTSAAVQAPGYIRDVLDDIRERYSKMFVSGPVQVAFKIRPDGTSDCCKVKSGFFSNSATSAINAIGGERGGTQVNYPALPPVFGGKELELRVAFGCEKSER